MAMLTLDEDCVSVVFPPSAAESPEMTRPLEKLRFPNKRLRVDEDDETCAKEGNAFLSHAHEYISRDDKDLLLPDWSAADAVLLGAAS